ncbi:MAG TPA: phosphoglycerate dehydrogenase, partial [Polyangiaceae bacterium]|nr:phosphoglycerate dehydrogenase [Polyangiaceae bacterium]
TNQVDLGAANKVGIPVFNAPFSNTRSVAELVLCEIVMLSRRVADRLHEMHAGEWQKAAAGCYEVRDKTLGIVGYGHIGRQVGVLAEALGMHVLYFDILAKLPMGNNRPMRTLEELLKQSRFVTLHVPETPETRNMIGARELAVIPAGGYLLNASRGSVVDVGALAAALASGHLAGAAVDVFPEEPEGHSRTFATPLRGLANVVLTPHIGGSTSEAQEAIGREVAAALIRHLRSGATTGAVNFPHVDPAPARGERRLANVHKNVPGALRSINHVVSDYRANIAAQVLATDAEIGYVVMDLDQNVDGELKAAIDGLETSIRTRML